MTKLVYCIQAGDTGAVKIGVAGDPWERARELQSGNAAKLSVLALLDGGYAVESHLHRAFRARRLVGEWFDRSVFIDIVTGDIPELPAKKERGLARDVIVLRGSVEEKARWNEAASKVGMSFSAWARRAMNEAADYEAVESEELTLDVPAGHRCPPKGVYCKGCGR